MAERSKMIKDRRKVCDRHTFPCQGSVANFLFHPQLPRLSTGSLWQKLQAQEPRSHHHQEGKG